MYKNVIGIYNSLAVTTTYKYFEHQNLKTHLTYFPNSPKKGAPNLTLSTNIYYMYIYEYVIGLSVTTIIT